MHQYRPRTKIRVRSFDDERRDARWCELERLHFRLHNLSLCGVRVAVLNRFARGDCCPRRGDRRRRCKCCRWRLWSRSLRCFCRHGLCNVEGEICDVTGVFRIVTDFMSDFINDWNLVCMYFTFYNINNKPFFLAENGFEYFDNRLNCVIKKFRWFLSVHMSEAHIVFCRFQFEKPTDQSSSTRELCSNW